MSYRHRVTTGLATLALAAATITAPALAQQAQASGEVRRVNPDQGRITIKHGAIPDLELPAMSLVYHATTILLQNIQPGDKVSFTAQRDGDRYVIIKISK